MKGYQTRAEFVCPICGKNSATRVEVPAPGIWQDGNAGETEGDVDVECMQCGAEYAGRAYVGPFHCNITLQKYPDTKVAANVPVYLEDEGWEDYEPPERPYSIFSDSDTQLTELLHNQGSATDGTHLINRLVFAHYIAAMEAFLADTLVNEVESDDESLTRLIESADLAKEKFTLSAIAKEPELVKSTVRHYVRSVAWHNLAKADSLYKIVLKIDLFGIIGEKRRELLFKAMQQRHDCVHRNGFDVEGKRLDVFTEDYIKEVAEAVRFLVGSVEGHIDFPRDPSELS